MKFVSRYTAHQPDENFVVDYTLSEHQIWQCLYTRQEKILPGRAVNAFISGLQLLKMSRTHIPQIPQINEQLKQLSDWQVKPVAAVISSEAFFTLLSQGYFPVATFIRSQDDLDYITEPDIFHELFGHVPLLTHSSYANFIKKYAKIALTFPKHDWNAFLRLFWFTIEFGLIETEDGLRIYGGGILSSYGETRSCLTSDASLRAQFDPVSILRTPYRIDRIQPLYFVIKDFLVLQQIIDLDFANILSRVHELGMFPPLYEPDNPVNVKSKDTTC